MKNQGLGFKGLGFGVLGSRVYWHYSGFGGRIFELKVQNCCNFEAEEIWEP